jgi:hypothetical protein
MVWDVDDEDVDAQKQEYIKRKSYHQFSGPRY